NLLVLDDEEAAAEATADRLAEAARAGLEIALTGGSTPRRAYELAALREQDWSRAGAWWGDERCVPPDDDRSNYRLARESLLDRVSRPPRVHRIRGELDPALAADEYERELGETRLDLVLLVLGPDGHVASLFPGAPTLRERERRVLETLGAGGGDELTTRELANRLGVDPGHLHFHVRMLLNAGLIELAERSGGREKPYRAVARVVRVAPELIATGAANDAREA